MSREHDYYIYMMSNMSRAVLYIGLTNSLTRRVSQHRAGEVEGFTERYDVNRLVYYEHYRNVNDAIAREKQLKRWSRGKKNALVAMLNPRWNDLGVELLGLGNITRGSGDAQGSLRDPSTSLGMTGNTREIAADAVGVKSQSSQAA